jgi:hypothetical protein
MPRPANNGTSMTTFEVPITDNTTTIWFFENSTCAQGGLGGININESSTETLAGFIVSVPLQLRAFPEPKLTIGTQRNAMRLNGTQTSSSAVPSATGGSSGSGSGSSSAPSSSQTGTSAAQRNVIFGSLLALPLAAAALVL